MREHNVKTMKNKNQSSGTGSRPHEQRTHNSCSLSSAPKRRRSDLTVVVKWDISSCKVISLSLFPIWANLKMIRKDLTNSVSIMFSVPPLVLAFNNVYVLFHNLSSTFFFWVCYIWQHLSCSLDMFTKMTLKFTVKANHPCSTIRLPKYSVKHNRCSSPSICVLTRIICGWKTVLTHTVYSAFKQRFKVILNFGNSNKSCSARFKGQVCYRSSSMLAHIFQALKIQKRKEIKWDKMSHFKIESFVTH